MVCYLVLTHFKKTAEFLTGELNICEKTFHQRLIGSCLQGAVLTGTVITLCFGMSFPQNRLATVSKLPQVLRNVFLYGMFFFLMNFHLHAHFRKKEALEMKRIRGFCIQCRWAAGGVVENAAE